MTLEARDACFRAKDLLVNASQLVMVMNETDPLILYTNAGTVSIGEVLMQEQHRVENPIIFNFISHILSDRRDGESWS